MTSSARTASLPPVAPEVTAAAVDILTSRLRKKLDAAIERCASIPVTVDDGTWRISYGEDALVTLRPGQQGCVTNADQARCSCLLAPRCLHRAAVLGACPIADLAGAATSVSDGDQAPQPEAAPGPPRAASAGPSTAEGPPTPEQSQNPRTASDSGPPAETAAPPSAAQVAAAAGLWTAAAAILEAGVPAAGAVAQADLLKAAHTARLAGLHRAEAAARDVVTRLRAARDRHAGHRLADLVAALRELLFTARLLAAAHPDPALVGVARRGYQAGGSLRVQGVCREPVISATGYAGVVTHLIADDGQWFSIADVKPGDSTRARGAGTATVTVGAASISHAELARGGLMIAGATVSPDGRLGSGRGVRANPIPGPSWSARPVARLFSQPVAEAVAYQLGARPGMDQRNGGQAQELIGCDLVIIGPSGDHVLARELRPAATPSEAAIAPHAPAPADHAQGRPARTPSHRTEGSLVRLMPADGHPDLAHTANLERLASRPGLHMRVVGRIDPERAATLRPLAVSPMPEITEELTLRLPKEWAGHADLGYDRLQGAHLPPPIDGSWSAAADAPAADPLTGSPLWRVRKAIELTVTGGRRAVAEPARGTDARKDRAALWRCGFPSAAELVTALTTEADRRSRDVFGRLSEGDPDALASAWLAAAVYLRGTERALVRASWQHHAGPGG